MVKEKKLICAIDIGNTSIACAVMRQLKMVETISVEHVGGMTNVRKKFQGGFTKLLKKYQIEAVVICSVVPKSTELISKVIKKETDAQIFVIGRNLKVPIKNKYQHPKQVGQDRLVCAYAVSQLYGTPAIIIDFGTATTFDYVSSRGAYEGGIIVPGIRLTTEALFQKTVMLPRIDTIEAPKNLIGKNTKDSMLSGIFYGYGAMSQGLIKMIKTRSKKRPKIIITGGYTKLMKRFINESAYKVDKYLVFKGMCSIFQEKKFKKK